jgi:hypothetical protein
MYNEVKIYFIYAENCIECKKQKDIITKAINDCNIGILYEINCETEEAIKLSLDNGIDDLPAYIIGKNSFCGEKCLSYSKLIDLIKEEWNEQNKTKNNKL